MDKDKHVVSKVRVEYQNNLTHKSLNNKEAQSRPDSNQPCCFVEIILANHQFPEMEAKPEKNVGPGNKVLKLKADFS